MIINKSAYSSEASQDGMDCDGPIMANGQIRLWLVPIKPLTISGKC